MASNDFSALVELAAQIGERLVARREMVAVAESSAGGLISSALLAVPGASRYFRGAGVIYTHEARRGLLAIPDDKLEGVRPSSEPYITILAQGIHARLETAWVLAESGATGPTGNRYGDAPGHACYAVIGPDTLRTHTLETGDDDRVANMFRFARVGLEQLDAAVP